MKILVYDPHLNNGKMTIVCFVSGSGTNYREIVVRNPNQQYLVFTNRPGCGGVATARNYKHEVIELSHEPFLKAARRKYGTGNVPRNCPERQAFEQKAVNLIESKLGGKPDLICLAGYDQWNTDWFVDRYFPRILNVHPGDTTKGHDGLHWVPTAKAILAGDQSLRSTLFFVDKSLDDGPVLVQSLPLDILETLKTLEKEGKPGLRDELADIFSFASHNQIKSYAEFQQKASQDLKAAMEQIGTSLQEAIKAAGDWKIYPFAVHDLIAPGRVEIDGRIVYVDGQAMPVYGYRLDEHKC